MVQLSVMVHQLEQEAIQHVLGEAKTQPTKHSSTFSNGTMTVFDNVATYVVVQQPTGILTIR